MAGACVTPSAGSVVAGSNGQLQYNNAGTIGALAGTFWDASRQFIGFGTTSSFATLSVNGAAGQTSPLFVVASSTSGFATSTVFQIDQNGNTTLGYGGGRFAVGTTSTGYPIEINPQVPGPGNTLVRFSSPASAFTQFTMTVSKFAFSRITTGSADLFTITSPDNSSSRAALDVQGNNGAITALWVASNGSVGIGTTTPSTQLQIDGSITPNIDNTYTDGNATYRWSAIYSANGTIQTSDARVEGQHHRHRLRTPRSLEASSGFIHLDSGAAAGHAARLHCTGRAADLPANRKCRR